MTKSFIQSVAYVEPLVADWLTAQGMGDKSFYKGKQLWKLYEDFLGKLSQTTGNDRAKVEKKKQAVINALRLGLEKAALDGVNEKYIDDLMAVPGVSREAAIRLYRAGRKKSADFVTEVDDHTHFASTQMYDDLFNKVDLGPAEARETWGAILSIIARKHKGNINKPGQGNLRPP